MNGRSGRETSKRNHGATAPVSGSIRFAAADCVPGAVHVLKDGVILVNTSRGGLICTEDLIAGIRDHKFFAVGLDVYEEESELVYEDMSERILQSSTIQRLLSFPNVAMTSHQGFFTDEALTNIAETTLQNAAAFRDGLILKNEVKL